MRSGGLHGDDGARRGVSWQTAATRCTPSSPAGGRSSRPRPSTRDDAAMLSASSRRPRPPVRQRPGPGLRRRARGPAPQGRPVDDAGRPVGAEMLAVSRQLNPDCEHVAGRHADDPARPPVFDAVLVHDAVDYVTSQEDLRLVIGTAFAHCRPGGLAVFAPDHTAETFRAGTGGGGGQDGSAARLPSASARQTPIRATTGSWPSTSSPCARLRAPCGSCGRRTGSAPSGARPGSASWERRALPRLSERALRPGTTPDQRAWSSWAAGPEALMVIIVRA